VFIKLVFVAQEFSCEQLIARLHLQTLCTYLVMNITYCLIRCCSYNFIVKRGTVWMVLT